MKNKIHTYDPKKGKRLLAGQFDSGVFYKQVKPRHYMIKEKGFGISEDVINQLKELDCKKIIIKTKKNKYEFGFDYILDRPIRNYGHGSQRFLRVK